MSIIAALGQEQDMKEITSFINHVESHRDSYYIVDVTRAVDSITQRIKKRYLRMALFGEEYSIICFREDGNRIVALLVYSNEDHSRLDSRSVSLLIQSKQIRNLLRIAEEAAADVLPSKLRLIMVEENKEISAYSGFEFEDTFDLLTCSNYVYSFFK